jgi:SH3 domain protein
MQRFAYLFIFIFTSSLTALSFFSNAQTKQSEQASELQQEPNDQNGEFRWVSDDLFTYLRAGPGKGYRLLGSVNAGTKIQLLQLDRDAGYAEIIDNRQRTGWIEIKYVSSKQSIRDDINDIQVLLKERDENLQNMQTKMQAVMKNLSHSDDQKAKLNRQVTQQLEELSRLNEQNERRERASNMQWFTRGSILALISLLIGYVLGILGRRRKAKNRLM